MKKINKICPFCPKRKSSYIYQTYRGLEKHIWRDHVINDRGKFIWEEKLDNWGNPTAIRIYKNKYSRFYDILINGEEHITAIIQDYVSERFNPSLRRIEKRNEE